MPIYSYIETIQLCLSFATSRCKGQRGAAYTRVIPHKALIQRQGYRTLHQLIKAAGATIIKAKQT